MGCSGNRLRANGIRCGPRAMPAAIGTGRRRPRSQRSHPLVPATSPKPLGRWMNGAGWRRLCTGGGPLPRRPSRFAGRRGRTSHGRTPRSCTGWGIYPLPRSLWERVARNEPGEGHPPGREKGPCRGTALFAFRRVALTRLVPRHPLSQTAWERVYTPACARKQASTAPWFSPSPQGTSGEGSGGRGPPPEEEHRPPNRSFLPPPRSLRGRVGEGGGPLPA